jgi:hypothetical protein
MTANDLRARVDELNALILQGKAMDAFEKFYHENVVMMEKNAILAEGKAANRAREIDFFSKVTEFRGAEVKAVAVGDDVTMVEWTMDYTHSEWGVMNYAQVAVQRWKDGLIIHERFYPTY